MIAELERRQDVFLAAPAGPDGAILMADMIVRLSDARAAR
jgi:hypothetical protein